MKFIGKYFAAQLLSRKLFQPASELDAFLEEVDGTTYAHNNRKAWEAILELSNAELQILVRRAWISTTLADRGELTNSFISIVVEPALRVHVGSVTSNVSVLSAQFLDALTAGNHSEPRQWPGWVVNI